jgi:hypothetical protein
LNQNRSRGTGQLTREVSGLLVRHRANLRHVVVKNFLLTAIVPFDGQPRPTRFGDRAPVSLVVLPANLITDFEQSGLFAGHRFTSATRFISPCPVKL